mmetsp:Transcript_4730/g.6576  ORF Transcript_4730/g.6576 Transcript_4730/m.6576 type:complete len:367 (-) Transcript_4730:409-1509(-)
MATFELAPFLRPVQNETVTGDAHVIFATTTDTEAGYRTTTRAKLALLLFITISVPLLLFFWVAKHTTTRAVSVQRPPTIAFFGNSMQYYNDSPRLVELVLREIYNDTTTQELQDSFLRGGANLEELWRNSREVPSHFGVIDPGASSADALLQKEWSHVVLQDDVNFVVHPDQRTKSLQALEKLYLPVLTSHSPQPTILLLETFPQQQARMRERTARMGDYDTYADAIVEGYTSYASLIRSAGLSCRVIPLGRALNELRTEQPDFWVDHVYHTDHIHPSPHTTWLQVCLIIAMTTGRAPTVWDTDLATQWQQEARFWQHTDARGSLNTTFLPLPTSQEAEILRQLACRFVWPSTAQQVGGDACSRGV